MEPLVRSLRIFRFGQFEADPEGNSLTRNGARIKIQDQPFCVLMLLLERPGEIVTREVLRQRLWPEGTYVDFDGSLNVIVKKLRAAIADDPENPRFIETVPRHGYRFIAPVSATEVSSAANASISEGPSEGEEASRPSAKRVYGLLLTATLLFAGAGWAIRNKLPVVLRKHDNASVTRDLPITPRKSAAVLGFHNVSGKPSDAWLSTGLSEMLSTELAGGDKLRLVSGEDIAHLRAAAPWSQTDTLNQETTTRIGKALDSDYLILGSYTTAGSSDHEQIRMDVRLQDAQRGEILAEIAEVGGSQDLFKLVSRVGARLRERLGIPKLDDTDQAGILASAPKDRDAARFYALGIEKLRQFDTLAAKNLLEQAVRAEPSFPLAHTMLSRAWSGLGYQQKRKEEAKKALDLANSVPKVDQLLVEGDYYESLPDHEKASSTYHVLFELFPDSVEYGLLLAGAQHAAGHDSQALETISRLRKLPAPASEDPRIDLLAARAVPANIPARIVLIRSAEKKAEILGNRIIYAQARKEECMNLNYSQEPTQASAACEEAYNVYMNAGNLLMAADTLRLMADTEGTLGHLEKAIATYQRALTLLEGIGDHAKTGAILNNMAIGYENEGNLDRAEKLYRQAKVNFEEAGDRGNTATALGNIADILFLRGHLSQAAKAYEQALSIQNSMENGSPDYVLDRLADLALAEGRVKDAHRLAQQAVELSRPNQGSYQYLTTFLHTFGETLKAEGDLKGARQQFQEALQLQQKANESGLVAESQAGLASLDLDEGHADQAEPLLRAAIAQFEKEHEDPSAAEAYTLLSRCLMVEGKLEDSRQAIQRAIELSHTSLDPALKLPAAIQAARIQATASDPRSINAARQQIRSTIAMAKQLGYYPIELDARRALAELNTTSNPDAAHAQLKAVAIEARARGLELIARQAEQLAAASQSKVAAKRAGS